jgi:iron complex outermembrane recepter protein
MRYRVMPSVLAPFIAVLASGVAGVASAQMLAQDLRGLSLEELMQVEVTTVSRTSQPGPVAPAAVFVITREDIRRAGVTSIVEALRLAPGVQVARIDANKWAVGIRGFPDRLSRSMLVMIDGRAVYSPLFAGTYWEVQDTFLPDIERIEVIRGPGGTLWGANAVNGIINIITRDAAATQGTVVDAGVGSEDHVHTGVRHGGTIGTSAHYRAYAKFYDRGPFFHPDGSDFDDSRMGQAGFRLDRPTADGRSLTVQGDVYVGEAGQRSQLTTYSPPALRHVDGDAELSGGNLLARWMLPRARLQVFYDRTNRREPTFREFRDTFDVDFQHTLLRGQRQELLWGAGYRVTASDIESVETQRFIPDDRTDNLFTAFVQDEITIDPDRLRLTFGAKFEHNEYSGFEAQPSGRLVWTPDTTQAVVLSVTRAVRTPSRVEHDFERTALLDPRQPLFLRLVPNDDFVPEKLVAYEAGYRVHPARRLYLTASAFFNHVTDILSTEAGQIDVEPTPPPVHRILPLVFANGLHGNTHGLEATADLRVAEWLRWTAAYSYLRVELSRDADSLDSSQERRGENLSPRNQLMTQASLDLPGGWEADWLLRYVGELPTFGVPAYTTSDVRVGYRLNDRIDLSIVGRDLHHERHLEFPGGGAGNVEVQRSVFARAMWRW